MKEFKNLVSQINPKCKFVLGGTKAWKNIPNDFIDFYVEGYADDSAISLSKYLEGKNPFFQFDIEENKYRRLRNDRKASNFNFTEYNFEWHESDYIRKNEALPIEISRGCIFQCSYCNFPLIGKKKFDYLKDPEILIEEFTRNYELYGTDTYMYSDDTHNESPAKLELLYDKVYSKLKFPIKFSTYIRLDLLKAHKHTIQLLRDSGIKTAFFGIESLNREANKTVGKGISIETIIETLHEVRETWKGVFLQSGFMLGLPNETEETITQWLNLITSKEFPLDHVTINPLHIFSQISQDSYWLNGIEKNPNKFGYTFTSHTDWVNNKGLTKEFCREIIPSYYIRARSNGKNLWSWITDMRLQNLDITKNEYKKMSKSEILNRRDSVMVEYINNLLK